MNTKEFIRTALEILELIEYMVQIYFEALCYAVSPVRFLSVGDYLKNCGEGFNYYVLFDEDLINAAVPTVDSALKATSRVFKHLRRRSSYGVFTKTTAVEDFFFGIID